MAIPNTKLETARLQRRWSVEAASSKIGVSTNTFNRWERGLQIPQLETLDLLCKAFAMSPEDLGFDNVISARRRPRGQDMPTSTQAIALDTPSIAPLPTSCLSSEDTHLSLQPQPLEQFSTGPFDVPRPQEREDESTEVSRRKAITLLVSTPAAVFGLTQSARSPILRSEEMLTLSAVNIPLCWQLYTEGGIREASLALPEYLAPLSTLAQQPSPDQKRAASLASQAHQLAYLLALQRQDFGLALKHTQEAAHYGEIADSHDLQVSSHVREAYVYYCLNRTNQRLHAYQQALPHEQGCSPLIRGYLYAGLAETYAALKNQDMARKYLDLAHHTFPSNPEGDDQFPYTHFRWPTIFTLEGLTDLHLNQPKQAHDAFTRVDQGVAPSLVPTRVELIVHQAATAFALDELEQSCELLASASTSALNLGSFLRLGEAYRLYERIQHRWPREPRLEKLDDIFRRNPPIPPNKR